jgi:alpha-galactosidase
MYSTAGQLTCARFPASLGYEKIDADTFAEWGVDYLKYDNCFNAGQSGTPKITHERYNKMALALNETGRPMLYSMCNWGEDYPWKWAQTMANSWRMSGDIWDSFDGDDPRCPCTGDEGIDCALPGFHCSVMNILNKVANFVDKGVPGAWNDMDMLQVGNGGMSDNEYKLHFTMWAAIKSPLLMGNDIRVMTPKAYSILTNPAILAISQDPLGSSVVRRWRYHLTPEGLAGKAEIQMHSGELEHGDWVVILLNSGPEERKMNATLADVFNDKFGDRSAEAGQEWDVYDLWANRMSDDTAKKIIDSADLGSEVWSSEEVKNSFFNVTAMSFAEGLKRQDPVLYGKHIGTVAPHGTIEAMVDKHSVAAFRLRSKGKSD